MHYWRIHERVSRRVLTDLSPNDRTEIATPNSELCKWFAEKVERDTTRLYEDENYYDNSKFSFQYPKHSDRIAA